MLVRCNKKHAPWYVVPADHKWLRDLAVAKILLAQLQSLQLRFRGPGSIRARMRVP